MDDDDEQRAGKLNEHVLQESVKESYQHSQFDTATELERQAIENENQAKIAQEMADNEERLKQEKEEEEGDEEEQGEGKEDGEEEGAQGKQNNEEEEDETGDDDQDEFEYEVFYDQE